MMRLIFFVFLFDSAVKDVLGKSLNKDATSSDSYEIIGGLDVDIKQYPHQVSLISVDNLFWCGGTILSQNFILTAAHCVEAVEHRVKYYKIRAGSTFSDKGGKVYNILGWYKHPKYHYLITLDYDVGVLKTENIAIDGVTTKPVQLAEAGSSLKPGEYIDVIGWGVTETGEPSPVLKSVSLPVINLKVCEWYWTAAYEQAEITERMFCAGYEDTFKTVGHGDSGGPAHAESSLIQYGIVSFGSRGCNSTQLPSGYTNIPAVRGWIKHVTGV